MSRDYTEVSPSYFLSYEKSLLGRVILNCIMLTIVIIISFNSFIYYGFYVTIGMITFAIFISLLLFKITAVKATLHQIEDAIEKGKMSRIKIGNYINWFTIVYILLYVIYGLF